jgi:hypothetical protein
VTVNGYWIDNWIYYNRALKYNTTESLRTPSVLPLTTHSAVTVSTATALLACQHYPGCWRTAGSLPLSLDTNSTHYLSGIYDLWTDGREDTFSERRPFLGTDSEETSISRYLVTFLVASEASRSVHVTVIIRDIPNDLSLF